MATTDGSTSKFSSASIAMHWMMLVLMAAVFACIELRSLFERGSEARELIKTWHYMLGLSVLFLVILRIVLYVRGPRPPISPAPPAWQRFAASGMHIVLYGFMIAMPIGGWMILSAEGHGAPFFGITLPPLIAENEARAEFFEGMHKKAGVVGYYLIAAHAAAALVHHYVLKDNGLRRMLPWGR